MKKILIGGLFFSFLLFSGCSLKGVEKKVANNQDKPGSRVDNFVDSNRPSNLPQEVESESRLVNNEAFSLEAAANWKESPALVPGVSLMMVDSAETSTRPEVRRINFKSYFSVSYATLDGKTLTQYNTYLKDKLTQMVKSITFKDLEPTIIDGRPTQVFSADLTQQGVDFKVLMFVATGKDNDVWMISFNTLAENLDKSQALFSQIATSFRVK